MGIYGKLMIDCGMRKKNDAATDQLCFGIISIVIFEVWFHLLKSKSMRKLAVFYGC